MTDRIELMYKQPGATEHQNITEVLDEIILRLRYLEERAEVEDMDFNYGGTN